MATELRSYVIGEHAKCSICLENVVSLKSLPCCHTFCHQCFKEHCKYDSPGEKVDCPVCLSVFVLPEKGVEQLPSDGLKDVRVGVRKPAERCE